MRRVVIVGMGIYSSIGTNKKEVLESLRKGFCGIGMDPSREGFNSKLTGIVPIPDKIPQHIRRYMAPQTCYMYNALNRALSTLIRGESAEVTFTSDRTENSAYKAVVTRKDDLYILELHDLDTDELKMSIEQCPKIFNDFDIGSEFYINYKPNDN